MRRGLRRKQLDAQLIPLREVMPVASPQGGWIKTIREALGMDLDAFSRRLGVASKSTAFQLEKAEVNESITLRRLKTAAEALGCDLRIVLIPNKPLTEASEDQARKVAYERLNRIQHSMVMENQAVYDSTFQEMVKNETRDILEKGDRTLWDS